MLAAADAAFVGRLTERPSGGFTNSGEPVIYVFEVEQTVKGTLGKRVEVVAAASSASCGIGADVGDRIGLFLSRQDARWLSSLCQQVSPEQLLAAARPLPTPDGSGPVALLAGGSFGQARTIALDRNGRTLGYGRGEGETLLLDACPGGARAVEIVRDRSRLLLAVRDLRTLRVVRQRSLRLGQQLYPSTIDCRTSGGEDVLLFASREAGPLGVILQLLGGRSQELHRGRGIAAVFGKRHAYLVTGRRANRLVAVDLGNGRARHLRTVPPGTGALALSPDGSHLAAVAYSPPFPDASPSRVLSIDLRTRPPRLRSAALRAANIVGRIGWLSRNRLAFMPFGGEEELLRVYDSSLRLQARLAWVARLGLVRADTAYGITWGQQAEILRANLPTGPARADATLPGQTVYAFEAVAPAG